MTTTMTSRPLAANQLLPGIHIAVIYDNATAAAYAHQAIGAISLALGLRARVDSQFWSFDNLMRLDTRHAGIHAAAEADVLVVAASADAPLPPHVESWIDAAVRDNTKGAPVMGMVIEPAVMGAGNLLPLERHLTGIAKRWRTPLLANQDLHVRLERELRWPKIGDGDSILGTHVYRRFPPTRAVRWGINE